MSSTDPTLILAITDKYGKVMDSPLFASVRVTAKLCKTLRFLANVAKKHVVDSMSVRHIGCVDLLGLSARVGARELHGGTLSVEHVAIDPVFGTLGQGSCS